MTVFAQHRSMLSPEQREKAGSYCGFYWHSTRIARKGTDGIFNTYKAKFQEIAICNKIDWDQTRELLFSFKKEIDQCYRNMMYHFRHSPQCENCKYWDDVYTRHLAKATEPAYNPCVTQGGDEVTDEEMMDIDVPDVNASS